MKPHDFSRLLLCSEKVYACDRLEVSSKAVRLMLTSKFEELFTADFGQLEDEEYRLLNLLQRILTVIYRRAQTDLTGLSLVERLIDAVMRQSAPLAKNGQFSNEEYLMLSLYGIVYLFLKENWTGKSYLFMNTEKWYEEERVIKSSEELMRKRRERLENIRFASLSEQQQSICSELAISEADFDSSDFGILRDPKFSREYDPRVFNEHMVINGEDCYTTMKFINFYVIAKQMLEVLSCQPDPRQPRPGRQVLLPAHPQGKNGFPSRPDDEHPDGAPASVDIRQLREGHAASRGVA